ncbi:MAG: glycosyltransferase [Coriobacteriia bacterium]|nr:glycosyltransferase [Coriobacteriia bacterium]
MGEVKHTSALFSILVPAFNAEHTLGPTLESLLAQELAEWQACVVDDGSQDATYEVARLWASQDARIVVGRKDNGGTASARNAAAAMATGQWLCLLDADDLALPPFLAHQATFIEERPGCDIYTCNVLALTPQGIKIPFHTDELHTREGSFDLATMLDANQILSQGAVFSREIFASLNGFREDLRYNEDYDFWLRALALGADHLHNPEFLTVYTIAQGTKTGNRGALIMDVRRIFEDLLESGMLSRTDQSQARARLRRLGAAEY